MIPHKSGILIHTAHVKWKACTEFEENYFWTWRCRREPHTQRNMPGAGLNSLKDQTCHEVCVCLYATCSVTWHHFKAEVYVSQPNIDFPIKLVPRNSSDLESKPRNIFGEGCCRWHLNNSVCLTNPPLRLSSSPPFVVATIPACGVKVGSETLWFCCSKLQHPSTVWIMVYAQVTSDKQHTPCIKKSPAMQIKLVRQSPWWGSAGLVGLFGSWIELNWIAGTPCIMCHHTLYVLAHYNV